MIRLDMLPRERPNPRQRVLLAGLPIAIGMVTPSLALLGVQVLVGRIAIDVAVVDVLQQQFAAGHNLFVLSLIGLIPFVALSAMMSKYSKWRTRRSCHTLLGCGLAGLLGLMIPAHVMVWYPLYGPGRMSSTAVIAFVFIPFYCTLTMFLGLAVGWVITKAQWFQQFRKGQCRRCGYDLTGNVSGTCPECGGKASSPNATMTGE